MLGRLVDKSLVLADRQGQDVRYRLLETFRQYGREHLADPAKPFAAHRRHYLALVELLAPSAELGEDDGWIRLLTSEHPNLRAAIASGLRDDPEEALRLVTALRWFWLDGGHLVEGLRSLRQALDARPERDAAAGARADVRGRARIPPRPPRRQLRVLPGLLDIARERGDGDGATRRAAARRPATAS